MRIIRLWFAERRIRRILADAGLPPSARAIFSGNVTVDEVVYDETQTFAAHYAEHFKDVRP